MLLLKILSPFCISSMDLVSGQIFFFSFLFFFFFFFMISGVLLPIPIKKNKENLLDEKPPLPPRDRDLNQGNLCALCHINIARHTPSLQAADIWPAITLSSVYTNRAKHQFSYVFFLSFFPAYLAQLAFFWFSKEKCFFTSVYCIWSVIAFLLEFLN